LVRWRALSELKSHFDLISWIAEQLPAEVLILSDREIPWITPSPSVRVQPVGEWPGIHPALRRLQNWKAAAGTFKPQLVMSLDEAYCLSTHQMVSWASRKNLPSIYLSCQNIDRPQPFPLRYVEGKAVKCLRGGAFLNEEALERAKRKGFRGDSAVIPLPVSPEDFPLLTVSSGIPSREIGNSLKVGYAGRFVPEKGVDTLINACAKTGDPLLAVGDGPDRNRLAGKARDMGIQAEWLGSIPSDRMPEVYSRMDVLVLPSLETKTWKEQFGRVLVEAMAAGVPVIGSRTGEIPNVIGDAGLLFEAGNMDALVDQITKIRLDPGLWANLRQRGLQRVRDRFTLERVGQQWLKLIRSCRE